MPCHQCFLIAELHQTVDYNLLNVDQLGGSASSVGRTDADGDAGLLGRTGGAVRAAERWRLPRVHAMAEAVVVAEQVAVSSVRVMSIAGVVPWVMAEVVARVVAGVGRRQRRHAVRRVPHCAVVTVAGDGDGASHHALAAHGDGGVRPLVWPLMRALVVP